MGAQSVVLARAENDGRPRATPLIQLPGTNGAPGSPGFRLFLTLSDIFPKGVPDPLDVKREPQHAWGFVYGSFALDPLMAAVFGSAPSGVGMEIFSGSLPLPQIRLARFSGGDLPDRTSSGRRVLSPGSKALELTILKPNYSQRWMVRFYTTELFHRESHRGREWWMLAGGLGLTACLSMVVLVQAHGRQRAEALAHQLGRSEDRLRQSLGERQRLSRDLHDNAVQSLYAVSVGLRRLRGRAKESRVSASGGDDQEMGRAQLRSGQELSATACEELIDGAIQGLGEVSSDLRRMAWRIEPAASRLESPEETIREMLRRMRRLYDAELTLTIQGDIALLPASIANTLISVIHEALSNSLRHGQARNVSVLVSIDDPRCGLEIRDDGLGFDPASAVGRGTGCATWRRI